MKQFDRELEFAERARTAQPDDPRPLVAKAEFYELQRQYEQARDCYKEAIQLDPSAAGAWNGLGNSLRELGLIDEALRAYDRTTELEPDWGWPLYNRAYALDRGGRLDESLAAIDMAIECEPDNYLFWMGKLWFLTRGISRRTDDADRCAERLLELGESDPRARVDVANYFADCDCIDRARDLLQGIEVSGLADEDDRLNLAECMLKVGNISSALDLLQEININQLRPSTQSVLCFLRLLADRLAKGVRISDEIFENSLLRFKQALVPDWDWDFSGIERVLLHSELRASEKFVFAALIDLQTGRLSASALSFFAGA